MVVPAFNHAKWLPEALNSILAQEGVAPATVIVVDDGSTDETSSIVRQQFPQIRYINQDNEGLAAARNTGLDNVTTELVCFLDSDDTMPPRFLRQLALVLARQPSSVAFAYSGVNFIGSDTRQFAADPWSLSALKRDNFVSATSLFRVGAIGPTRFDRRLEGWEDWDFMLSLAERGLVGVPVTDCMFNYRKHWDEPSMFDVLVQNRVARARARRYIVRKHRTLYRCGDLLRADLAVAKALGGEALRNVR